VEARHGEQEWELGKTEELLASAAHHDERVALDA
jgi:hypothetical protein